MAPKRGGYHGKNGGYARCPNGFVTTYDRVNFASVVVFFAVFFGIALASYVVRKNSGPGKKLIGVPYILGLLLLVLYYICAIIATALQQCEVGSYWDFYNWSIALSIFSLLGQWLLLYVVVYQVTNTLRQQLGGRTSVFKIITLVVVGIMGAFTIAYMSLACYNAWTQTPAGNDANATPEIDSLVRVQLAYTVLYTLSVLVAGGLALLTLKSLQSKKNSVGNLMGWVSALSATMFIWSMIGIIFAAIYFQDETWSLAAISTLSWIGTAFQAGSFTVLLFIAKHPCWGRPEQINW